MATSAGDEVGVGETVTGTVVDGTRVTWIVGYGKGEIVGTLVDAIVGDAGIKSVLAEPQALRLIRNTIRTPNVSSHSFGSMPLR